MHLRGIRAPHRTACVVSRRELLYLDPEDASLERPAHVRAASGMCAWGDRLALVQDDALFLAFADPRTGRCACVALPPKDGARTFDARRGNKRIKPDLESVVALDGRLVGLPSGSAPGRDQLAVDAAWFDGRALYQALRRLVPGELNVEGARLDRGELWLFNRGNGAVGSVDARFAVARGGFAAWLGGGPAPAPRLLETWDLGALHGVRLSFTDVTDDGPALFSAAAEASPNAVDDGAVLGIAVGSLADGGWAEVEEGGLPIRDKIEGLSWLDGALWACTDPDDPDRPGELLEIALGGHWR